jgi:hypothetical protein
LSFLCEKCGTKTKVMETRDQMRDRYCPQCNHIFCTVEITYDDPMKFPSRDRTEHYRDYHRQRREAAVG